MQLYEFDEIHYHLTNEGDENMPPMRPLLKINSTSRPRGAAAMKYRPAGMLDKTLRCMKSEPRYWTLIFNYGGNHAGHRAASVRRSAWRRSRLMAQCILYSHLDEAENRGLLRIRYDEALAVISSRQSSRLPGRSALAIERHFQPWGRHNSLGGHLLCAVSGQ